MNIYEIKQEYFEIMADLEAAMADPEALDQGALDALNDRLAINGQDFKAKAEAYAAMIGEKQMRAKYLKAESKRLADLAKRELATAERLKNTIANAMMDLNMDKADTDRFKLSFRQSEAVDIIDPEAVPPQFFVQELKLSKSLVKDALKRGPVAGAQIITKKNLHIK